MRETNKKLTIAQQNLKKFTGRLLSQKEEELKELLTTLHDELGSMALSVASKISIAKEDIKIIIGLMRSKHLKKVKQ